MKCCTEIEWNSTGTDLQDAMGEYKISNSRIAIVSLQTSAFPTLTTRLKIRSTRMCHLTETYYTRCSHWGSKRVETPCEVANLHGWTAGCSSHETIAATRVEDLCGACKHRERCGQPGVAFTHTSDQSTVPLSRESIQAKPMTLERQENDERTQMQATALLLCYIEFMHRDCRGRTVDSGAHQGGLSNHSLEDVRHPEVF